MTANCKINSPIDSDTNARQQHDPHTNHQLTTSFFARAPDNAGSACAVALGVADAGASLCVVTRTVIERDVRRGSSAQELGSGADPNLKASGKPRPVHFSSHRVSR
jgi:hypothetical protein